MKKRFLEAFLFLVLFSSLGSAAPLHVECQNLYPDEWLDLAATLKGSADISSILIAQTVASPGLILEGDLSQPQHPGSAQSQRIFPKLGLSVTLRC